MGRSDKKIARDIEFIREYLDKINENRLAINNEKSDRKINKLNKKIDDDTRMIILYIKELEKLGADKGFILSQFNDIQQRTMNSILPNGLDGDSMERQKNRNYIIKTYRNKILKIKEAQMSNPPYDPTLPFDVKMDNRIFKLEKSLGVRLYDDSNKESSLYEPDWNYLEHMATSQEFTEEEKAIMDRCYKIGQEYYDAGGSWLNRVTQSAIDFGSIVQSKMLCKKLYSDTFSKALRTFNPEKQYTAQQLEYEAKEMTKRSLYFFLNEDIRKPYVDKWQELYNDSRLDGLSDDKKLEIVSEAMDKAVGKELTLFTYLYTMVTTEQMMRTLNQIGQYTFEELGLN